MIKVQILKNTKTVTQDHTHDTKKGLWPQFNLLYRQRKSNLGFMN